MVSKWFSFWGISLILLLASCGGSWSEKLKNTPNAIGMTNQFIVIADDPLWEGHVGDSFRYKFESAYPIMPQPEALFDVRHYTPNFLHAEAVRMQLRTYIYLADLKDTSSLTTKEVLSDLGSETLLRIKEDPKFSNKVGRDKWAKGQLIIYLFGYGEESLVSNIKQNFKGITKRINEFDRSQLSAYTYLNGENHKMKTLVQEKFGVQMKIPGDYVSAIEDTSFLWLRKDQDDLNMNILLYSLPYKNTDQLTKSEALKLGNKIGKKYITTNTPGSYMRINDEDLPVFTYIRKIDESYTLESRGIWEMTYDYIGGPFFSYLIKHPQKNELIFVNCFMYAPGKSKRNLMQQMELVATTIQFSSISD